jgi:uncharacterized protein YgbK (DUF1537 family)
MNAAGPAEPALPLAATLAALPAEWPEDLLPAIRVARRTAGETLVVVDDDPTGTQTVHGVPVLTEWSSVSLQTELAQSGGAHTFYLLTNSRSLAPAAAMALNGEIGRGLLAAAGAAGRRLTVISRSDSTLRGHFPAETDALVDALGGVDATLLVPAFLAGGRYTLDDVHYVAAGDRLVPAAQTEFARDYAFGYAHSNLRQWVAEKTAGRVAEGQVASISLDDLRRGGPQEVSARLQRLPPRAVCVVNAASERDLEVLALAALRAEAAGRRFLYRTAASFARVRAGLAERRLLTRADLGLPDAGGALIVAGSYVPKTTAQVAALRAAGVNSVEVHVPALLDGEKAEAEVAQAAQAAEAALAAGRDMLIYTSRELVTGLEAAGSLELGRRISRKVVAIVRSIRTRPRYLLAKGGVTSSDVATLGLGVRRATVLGQIQPGVPAWLTGPESRWPGLLLVVFPGNVGGPAALAEVVATLRPAYSEGRGNAP